MKEKLVLLGKRKTDNLRVVIKVSHSPQGKVEIIKEKKVQDTLSKVIFSREDILFPQEIYYGERGAYLIRITNFIPQEKVFASYSLDEQFFKILREFEVQEGFYANTFEHLNIVKSVFPITKAEDYLKSMRDFIQNINHYSKDLSSTISKGEELIKENLAVIDERSNYLTHTDFVPSNFRLGKDGVYMIDLSSMHFGNRYEGLARFVNYCIIYSPELGKKICEYIRKNRGEEDYLCLRLMRIYKAGFLLNHYTKIIKKTDGNLCLLTQKRIELWHKIIDSLIKDEPIDEKMVQDYKARRDELRSNEELRRQREFNPVS